MPYDRKWIEGKSELKLLISFAKMKVAGFTGADKDDTIILIQKSKLDDVVVHFTSWRAE